MKLVRPVISTVGGVGSTVRDLARLQQVARILVRHGLGLLVAGLDVPGLARVEPRLDGSPERVLKAVEELGPTFVKLGQVLSTRPDLLPVAYCDAFARLQDDVDPLPFEAIRGMLDDALGEDWREQIDLDERPLATASIAQVHRGVLPDGQQVVLKVQRPGIAKVIRADLNILDVIARRLLAEVPESKSFDPLGVLAEFERSITGELDFAQEVEHMEAFRRNFADDPVVHVPVVVESLSTSKVLCMEFFDGVKMRDAREAGSDMQVVGERYLKCAYDMLFVHGLFHGDLHPGNVIVLPGEVLGLIDFGMVGRMTREMRDNVISIMFAMQKGDFRTVARLFYEIAIKDERLDYRAIERETVSVMEKHWTGTSIQDMQMGAYIMDLAQRAAQQGARIPTNYAMLFKAIMTSEGLAKSLIPEVDPIGAIRPYFVHMLEERFSRESLEQELTYQLFTLQSLLARLPVTVTQFLDDVDAQRLRIQIEQVADDSELRAADRRTNRVVLAGLTATCLLCGTLPLLSAPTWSTVAAPVLVFYGLAIVLGLTTLWSVWRGSRPSG